MTSNKTETVPTPEAAPMRSAARATLANRIAGREAARQKVQDREAAARRLTVIGETAQAIASDLTAAKARDAQRLAEYALEGNGKLPPLTDEGRAQLYARLLEAEAKAEAATPALAIVQTEIASAHAAFNQANASVQVVDVMAEELSLLDNEIRVLTDKIVPLHERLAGLRNWALGASAGATDSQRVPVNLLMAAITSAMEARRVSLNTPTKGTEDSVWRPFAAALLQDPDSRPMAA